MTSKTLTSLFILLFSHLQCNASAEQCYILAFLVGAGPLVITDPYKETKNIEEKGGMQFVRTDSMYMVGQFEHVVWRP